MGDCKMNGIWVKWWLQKLSVLNNQKNQLRIKGGNDKYIYQYNWHHHLKIFVLTMSLVLSVLTLLMGFKTRVDAPLPALGHLRIMDPWSQLWLPRPRPGPNFTPWHGEATARVNTRCHFWDCWQIRTRDRAAQIPMLYRLYWHWIKTSLLAKQMMLMMISCIW